MERFNRTLLQMLGTLENKDKRHWKEFAKPLVHTYNCTRSDVTGFSPYELMFGRQPHLPVDLAFGLPASNQPKSHSQYVHDLKGCLEESYRIATENSVKIAERNKLRFDRRVVESTLEAGDRVLVRNVRLRGKHKLADKWESDVHVVVKRAGNLPVYTVKPEGKDGPQRTLHRDLLLPCGFLTVPESEVIPKQTTHRPRTRKQSRMNVIDESKNADPNSDSEDDDYYYYPSRELLNTDLIETRILTRPETVPPREEQARETRQPTQSPVGMLSAPTGLDEMETSVVQEQDEEKGCVSQREAAELPVELIPQTPERPLGDSTSGGLTPKEPTSFSQWRECSARAESEAEVIPEHREAGSPKSVI